MAMLIIVLVNHKQLFGYLH